MFTVEMEVPSSLRAPEVLRTRPDVAPKTVEAMVGPEGVPYALRRILRIGAVRGAEFLLPSGKGE